MRFKFRIHGLDMKVLNRAEVTLRRLVRDFGFDAEICKVNEILEHGRMGISDALPVLEINGVVVTRKTPLTEETLHSICERLHSLFSGEKPSPKKDVH